MGAPQTSFLMRISVTENAFPRVSWVIPGRSGAAAVRSTARSVRNCCVMAKPPGVPRKYLLQFVTGCVIIEFSHGVLIDERQHLVVPNCGEISPLNGSTVSMLSLVYDVQNPVIRGNSTHYFDC